MEVSRPGYTPQTSAGSHSVMVWVGLTGLISCLGLLLSSLSIIPVILILQSQTKHAALLPFIPALKVDQPRL